MYTSLFVRDSASHQALWQIRENVPVSLMQLSRERISDPSSGGVLSVGRLFKYDVSLSLANTDGFLADLRAALSLDGFALVDPATAPPAEPALSSGASEFRHCSLQLCNFGHAGDQNLHLNLLATIRLAGLPCDEAAYIARVQATLNAHVFSLVLSCKGDFSDCESICGQSSNGSQAASRRSTGWASRRDRPCCWRARPRRSPSCAPSKPPWTRGAS